MKRGTFKKPTIEEVRKKQAAKRAKLKSKPKPKKAVKKSVRDKNKQIKTISTPLPKWIAAIPENKSHGSGTYQKRLWKLTSDFVRIRDWYSYKRCAATGKYFDSWRESHAGHLKPYTNCNGIFKFDVRNIHAQHGNSNKFGNYDTFREMEKEVKRRGYDWDTFEKENQQNIGARLYDSEVIEEMKKVLTMMADLPEQPDYYHRAVSLIE